MEKLIKNVDHQIWQEFKAEAVRHGLRLGEFLKYLIKEHKTQHKKNAWEYVLKGKKRLSDEEAKAINTSITGFEKIYEFEQ